MLGEKYQLKTIKYTCGHKFAIWISSACFIRWSTSVPAVGYWLLDHVTYLTREKTKNVNVVKSEQIHKMTINFTQKGQKLSF